MSIPLNHARHNKAASEYLFAAENDFPDWVVTTSFYCAMHYVYAAIFPFTELNVTYANLEAYFNKHKHIGDTKHSVTLGLVQKKHSCIANKYKELKDVAFTSRYQDYLLPKQIVAKVRKNLNTIEKYCEDICEKKAADKKIEATVKVNLS